MKQHDAWLHGAPYEAYMGRLSRLVAREFVPWMKARPGGQWLDVGCGTGTVSRAILENGNPALVLGIDPSKPFAAYAREQTRGARACFSVADAQALPFCDGAFDAVVSGLALNFFPDPASAVAEMARVASRHGVVAAYVWDYAEGMQPLRIFWAAAVEVDPAAIALDEGPRFPICRKEPLAELLAGVGLRRVTVTPIHVAPRYRDFDDYWQPFLGGTGPAPGYLAGLSDEQRIEMRERVRSKLPIQPDGGITLQARAWAARGRKSERDE